jgi:hypothetical protein
VEAAILQADGVILEVTVHYEVRERKEGELQAIHRACMGLRQHFDTDDQSADPRDVTCVSCLIWLDLVLKDRRKKVMVKK